MEGGAVCNKGGHGNIGWFSDFPFDRAPRKKSAMVEDLAFNFVYLIQIAFHLFVVRQFSTLNRSVGLDGVRTVNL